MRIDGPGFGPAPGYGIDFGALTIPYLPGVAVSLVMRGLGADTISVRTGTGHIALSLYSATADGTVPGYVGSCLRYLASEHVASDGLECPSFTELAGTTPAGIHIRFVAVTGPYWLLRAGIRTHIDQSVPHFEMAARILAAATVRIPRHYPLGEAVELSTNPTWIPDDGRA